MTSHRARIVWEAERAKPDVREAHEACFVARSVSCPVDVEWRRAEVAAA